MGNRNPRRRDRKAPTKARHTRLEVILGRKCKMLEDKVRRLEEERLQIINDWGRSQVIFVDQIKDLVAQVARLKERTSGLDAVIANGGTFHADTNAET